MFYFQYRNFSFELEQWLEAIARDDLRDNRKHGQLEVRSSHSLATNRNDDEQAIEKARDSSTRGE
jgi:hypothetical protein